MNEQPVNVARRGEGIDRYAPKATSHPVPLRFLAFVTIAVWLGAPAILGARVDPTKPSQVREELARLERMLDSGDWKAASKGSDRLIMAMANADVRGDRSRRDYAAAFALHGLAAEELGRHDEAMWDWGCARALAGGEAFVEPERFGAGQKRLEQESAMPRSPQDPEDLRAEHGKGFAHPKSLSANQPEFPSRARRRVTSATVLLRIRIGTEGEMRDPRPLSEEALSQETPFYVVTLRAMRSWRFEPATIDGPPVEVTYSLTTNFLRQ